MSGSAAGACAKVCVYPLDVLKKRLQIRGFEKARQQFGKVGFFSLLIVHNPNTRELVNDYIT